MVRKVGIAGAAFLLLYAVASVATGQQLVALGDVAQLIPPLAYAAFTTLAGAPEPRPGARVLEPERHPRRHVGDRPGGVDLLRSVRAAACPRSRRPIRCSSCRAFRSRRRCTDVPSAIARAGSSTSSLLDLVLIALFAAFVYIYFVVYDRRSPTAARISTTTTSRSCSTRKQPAACAVGDVGVADGALDAVAADARRLRDAAWR